MLISITEIKKRERDYLCKALKSKLLLGISSNTYQAKVFRVKRTERERVGSRGASNLELEGDPGHGKLMVIGKNPFPTFSPARNGHQRIRRVHNEVMLCGCKKSIENSAKVMGLNAHEVPTMGVYGGKL
jgi:hypothetical protein